jgi:hypothetical protein
MTRHSSFLAVGALLAGAAAQADITLEERLSVEGAGLMRMANMSGTTKTTIAGDKSRIESDLQLQSRLVRMMARGVGGPSADIVRLDEDKVYQLDLKKKQYTESSFEELRTRMQAAQQQAQQQGKAAPAPIDESQCDWSPPKADVKRTGEKASFAGYEAERLMILATQSCRNKETGAVCDVTLSLDEWLAPKFDGGADALKFQRAYAERMGFDAAVSRDLGERAKSMFGRYEGVWKEIAQKTRDVKGYPVKTSFAFALGGAQCQNQAQSGGSSPGSAGGITGQIVGSILGRKKAQESQTSQTSSAAAALPPGMVPLITMTSELVSASTAPAPAGAFDVPADFKKAAAQ